jgi:hypothetical protein
MINICGTGLFRLIFYALNSTNKAALQNKSDVDKKKDMQSRSSQKKWSK